MVGISKNNGSDKLIKVALPVDSTLTVAVFRYATVNLSADYDLYSWVLSARPGDTLEDLEAPKSATSNKIESISFSWTEAIEEEWHLGAISQTTKGRILQSNFYAWFL